MSDTYEENKYSDSEQNETQAETHHSHHHGSHHSDGEHRHHSHNSHHHRSGSQNSYKSHKYRESKSSELERKGHSVIYESAKKDKIKMFIKRSFFCLVVFIVTAFVFASILNPNMLNELSLFEPKKSAKEEINELKIKIIQYEDKIEELEAIIEKYENGELP